MLNYESVHGKNMRLTCCCIFLDLSLISVAMCSDVSLFRVLDDSMNPLVSSEDSPNSLALLNSFLSSFEFDFMLKLHDLIKLYVYVKHRRRKVEDQVQINLYFFVKKFMSCALFNLATFIRIFLLTDSVLSYLRCFFCVVIKCISINSYVHNG